MARNTDPELYQRPVRRLILGLLIAVLTLTVLLWRIDNPRAERVRAAIVDAVVPNLEWAMVPVTKMSRLVQDFEGYTRVYEQNQELRRELQTIRNWRERALQLEQENARLLDLNKVRLSPELTFVTGVVLTDSGSPFRRSVLLNIGRNDGIQDGWAAVDGLGVVGRISGIGAETSRVILITDPGSRIPVTIQPSGKQAILSGDTTGAPLIEFLERTTEVNPGDRVVTSGDGGVFPPDLLVGRVVQDPDRRWRVFLTADLDRLEFLRVLRAQPAPPIDAVGGLIVPLRAADTLLPPAPEPEG